MILILSISGVGNGIDAGMKILWVVNTIFPDVAAHIGIDQPVSGGWMYSLASDLVKIDGVELIVATVYSGKILRSFTLNDVLYYLIPAHQGANAVKRYWVEIVSDNNPDFSHIHGTEYGHGMALMESCPGLRCVVSLQGLVSVIHRYYLAGLSSWDVLKNITFRDIVRRDTLFHGKYDFYKRGLVEREYIRRAAAVIGRTDWDQAHAKAINPTVRYFFCNESLRSDFYTDEKWKIENKTSLSIFLSQAGHPIKGLHQVLKAVAFLKSEYPGVTIEIAGANIVDTSNWKSRLRLSGYGNYIRTFIREAGLESNIRFLGPLNANQMKKAYLRCNVFICPSSIENSPNSLGEAQILGVPCIASYVGGIPSMNNRDSALLYRFDEPEMLALNIRNVFINDGLALSLSERGAAIARMRHDRSSNLIALSRIYSDMSVDSSDGVR